MSDGGPAFIGRELVLKLKEEIFSRWYTEDEGFKDLIMAAVLTPRSKILLIGPPEAGKTTLVRLIAKGLSKGEEDGVYAKIIGAPEKTLQKVLVTTNVLKLVAEGREEYIVRPIVKARVKFINEINRFSKAVQDALLSLLEEGEIEYGGAKFRTPSFIAFADMNPYRGEIDRALQSRFTASAYVPHPPMAGSVEIARSFFSGDGISDLVETMPTVMSFGELEEVWKDVARVSVPQRVLLFASMVVWAFRVCKYDKSKIAPGYLRLACAQCEYANEICSQVRIPPGERAVLSLIQLAKARAWLDGRAEVGYEDVVVLAPYVIAHRVEIAPSVRNEFPNAWEWAKHSVEMLMRTKWVLEDGRKRIFGVWTKGLALACRALEIPTGKLLSEVLEVFYPDALRAGDPWVAIKKLRALAYGESGMKGDLVLQQLYRYVRKRFREQSQSIVRRLEPVVRAVVSRRDVSLRTLMRVLAELDKALPEDAQRLRDEILAKLEEFTIRIPVAAPGMYDRLRQVLKRYGFSNKEIADLMTRRVPQLEGRGIVVRMRGGVAVVRVDSPEEAKRIREELGL